MMLCYRRLVDEDHCAATNFRFERVCSSRTKAAGVEGSTRSDFPRVALNTHLFGDFPSQNSQTLKSDMFRCQNCQCIEKMARWRVWQSRPRRPIPVMERRASWTP